LTFKQFPFDRRIDQGIRDVGYTAPTRIQQEAIPVVLEGRDVLGIAQTGTGKTAAFVLPILQRLTSGARRGVRALILAPTRELAEQTHRSIVDLGRHTGVRSAAVYGGVGKKPQLEALRRGAQIVVACPGRLLDHMSAGHIDLSHVEVLVLDEADRMCDMGFLPDIRRILKQLPAKRQTLFFSATMPREIRALASTILDDPQTIQIGRAAPVAAVSHAIYPVPQEMKSRLLHAVLEHTSTGRVLVFTRTKHRAHGLAQQLRKHGHRVAALQGNMTQSQRQRAMTGFRAGRIDVLVATDIAARGIDVTDISHVINYDMPDTIDAYTHRIGRTGRAEQTGEAFTLAVRGDGAMVQRIEQAVGTSIERRRLAGFDYGDFTPESQFPRRAGGSSARSFRTRGRGRLGSRRTRAMSM